MLKLLTVVPFELPLTGIIFLSIFIPALFIFIGYIFGRSKRGSTLYETNSLPKVLFKVVKTDQFTTTLEELTSKGERWLVSTRVFGGSKAIREGKVVKHFNGSWKQQKALGLPNLGYTPLVVDEINSVIFKDSDHENK